MASAKIIFITLLELSIRSQEALRWDKHRCPNYWWVVKLPFAVALYPFQKLELRQIVKNSQIVIDIAGENGPYITRITWVINVQVGVRTEFTPHFAYHASENKLVSNYRFYFSMKILDEILLIRCITCSKCVDHFLVVVLEIGNQLILLQVHVTYYTMMADKKLYWPILKSVCRLSWKLDTTPR